MKAFFGMLVAITLVAGGSAEAAVTKARARATAKKISKVTKSKSVGQKVAAAPAQTQPVSPAITPTAPTAPEAAPAAAATTTTVAAATSEAVTKRWGVMYDMWNEAGARDVNLQSGDVEATETVRVSYKLTPTLSASLTGAYVHSWGYTKENTKTSEIVDPYLMIAKSKLLGDTGALSSKGYIRFYPGVSESSRNKGQLGFLRGSFNIGADLGKVVSIAWETQPRYYFQTYKTYDTKEKRDENDNLISASQERANTQARIKHFVNLGLNFTSKFSAYQNVGVDYVWKYSDPEATNESNRDVPAEMYHYAETGLGYSISDNVSLTAGIYTELARNQLTQDDDFEFYGDDESLYFLEGTLTF